MNSLDSSGTNSDVPQGTGDLAAPPQSAGHIAGGPERRRKLIIRLCVLAAVATAVVLVLWFIGDELSLKALAERESRFRSFQREHPVLVYVIAFGAYMTVAALSLPGATPMTVAAGWLFGFWRGVLLVSFASTLGATLAFLLSRYLFRDAFQRRYGDRLQRFNAALDREGPFYLFTLRLIPAVPFFVINAVMGLTGIRVRTFWWVSQLGMLPGTAVYVYAGASVPNLQTLAEQGAGDILSPRLVAAFIALGLFPLAARWIMRRLRRETGSDADSAQGATS